MAADDLRSRSIRTLAWLGDAAFEREVRWRIAGRGDYAVDRLDAIKADVVRAEAQADLLTAIEASLTEEELAVAARARNATVSSTPRGAKRDMQTYRRATALEALVAHWALSGEVGTARFAEIVDGPLDAMIDEAVARRAARPRRG
jgi:ribonuclease-3 family protein